MLDVFEKMLCAVHGFGVTSRKGGEGGRKLGPERLGEEGWLRSIQAGPALRACVRAHTRVFTVIPVTR